MLSQILKKWTLDGMAVDGNRKTNFSLSSDKRVNPQFRGILLCRPTIFQAFLSADTEFRMFLPFHNEQEIPDGTDTSLFLL